MIKAVILILATGAVSYFLANAEIIERPREWLEGKSKFLRNLVRCAYCLGHWIATPLVLIYKVKIISLWPPLDYVLTIMVVAWVAALLVDIFWNATMPSEGRRE